MREIKISEFERCPSIFEPVITDHVCLRLVNIAVDQSQVSEVSQLGQPRVDQVQETQDSDRVRGQIESLQGADLGDSREDEALRGGDQGALEGQLHDWDSVETQQVAHVVDTQDEVGNKQLSDHFMHLASQVVS